MQWGEEQHVIAIKHELVERGLVFLPNRTIVESAVDDRAILDGPKRTNPGKPIRVAFEELPDGKGSKLLKGLWKIALEITGELLAFAGFNRITAKFEYLENARTRQIIHGCGLWRRCRCSLRRPSAAQNDQRQGCPQRIAAHGRLT